MHNVGHAIDWINSSMLYKSKYNIGKKIVESCYMNSIPNFNVSVGQWTIDLVLSKVIKMIILNLAYGQAMGHVT